MRYSDGGGAGASIGAERPSAGRSEAQQGTAGHSSGPEHGGVHLLEAPWRRCRRWVQGDRRGARGRGANLQEQTTGLRPGEGVGDREVVRFGILVKEESTRFAAGLNVPPEIRFTESS